MQLKPPKSLNYVEFIKLEPNRADYRVTIPRCGFTNAIESLVIVDGNNKET